MIKGVIIKELSEYSDERGWLTEIYRKDSHKLQAAMSYVSFTKFNQIRGPHEHKEQTDFFVFIGPGDFELYLWDNRKDLLRVLEPTKTWWNIPRQNILLEIDTCHWLTWY